MCELSVGSSGGHAELCQRMKSVRCENLRFRVSSGVDVQGTLLVQNKELLCSCNDIGLSFSILIQDSQ